MESRQVRRANARRADKGRESSWKAAEADQRAEKVRANRRARLRADIEARKERNKGKAERALRYLSAHARRRLLLAQALAA